MSAQGFDFGKEGGRAAAAEWLLKRSDAIVVVMVRKDDAVLVASDNCAPRDAGGLVVDALPGLIDALNFQRTTANRRAARARFEGVHE